MDKIVEDPALKIDPASVGLVPEDQSESGPQVSSSRRHPHLQDTELFDREAVEDAIEELVSGFSLPDEQVADAFPHHAFGATNQGRRNYNEDRFIIVDHLNQLAGIPVAPQLSYYAVYDGHAGAEASEYCLQHLHLVTASQPSIFTDPEKALFDAFVKVDKDFCFKASAAGINSGTTAVAAVMSDTSVVIAHVGDSRAVLCRDGQAVDLSHDHKPNGEAERARVEAAGGIVVFIGVWRVNGILGVSRSIGDRTQSKFVIAEPDTGTTKRGGDDEFIILASDGLWDVMSSQDAVDFVTEQLCDQIRQEAGLMSETGRDEASAADDGGDGQSAIVKEAETILSRNPRRLFTLDGKKATDALVQHAVELGSNDNITALVVFFL